jgi:hypothetical protein
MTQIIYTGNEYEEADRSNSEVPEWPVQDNGAHWHHEQFDGQRVHFTRSDVHFGFEAEYIGDVDDISDDVLAGDVFVCSNGKVYK